MHEEFPSVASVAAVIALQDLKSNPTPNCEKNERGHCADEAWLYLCAAGNRLKINQGASHDSDKVLKSIAFFAIVLTAATAGRASDNDFQCVARQAQVLATVAQTNYVIENGHDPVCLVTINVTSARPNSTCPLLMGDLGGQIVVETNYRYSAEECRNIPSRVLGILTLSEDPRARGTIEIEQ